MRRLSEARGQTVLCAVDFSVHSRAAVRYGAAIAKRLRLPLSVLFVNDPLLVAAAAHAYDERALAEDTQRELRRFVKQSLGPAVPRDIQYLTITGNPAHEIKGAATRLNASLVALGTHGLRGARRVLFGSTTQQLLKESALPVLAVPPRAPRKPVSGWPGRQMAIAVDLSHHSEHDARAAAEFAERCGARLVLLHVVRPVQAPPWLKLRRGRGGNASARDAKAALTGLVDTLGGRVEGVVLSGDPAEAIASFAGKRRLGLVMLRLRRGEGVIGSRPGALTYGILQSASTPVLALPSGVHSPG